MTQLTHFSSEEEVWSEINTFPSYAVSNKGRVMNNDTKYLIAQTTKPNGLVMVGLMQAGVQYKRSLALLVANAFVHRPQASFDTPIHFNGNRSDNHYRNLTWRPLWFARKYMKQFVDDHQTYDSPIEDIETGERYKNSMTAAVMNGVLDSEIRTSMLNNTYVWPTGQVFRDVVIRG